jgi:hypothetical protein
LGDNWQGSVVIQSDAEMAAVAEITWEGGGAAPDGTTAGAYSGYAEGAERMLLPFAVRASFQFTRIAVQNTENSSTSFSMKYVNRDGVVDATINDSLPGLGSKTYDLSLPSSVVPDLTQTTYYSQNGFWTGAVVIETQGSQKIAAVATNHWNNWAVSYNGSASSGQEVFVASAERRYDPVQDWRGFTVVIAQCAEDSQSCDVRLRYINANTGTTDLTLPRTIVAGAALGANTRNGGDWDFEDFEVLGDLWVGSVVVDTTNQTDISVIVYTIRPGTLIAGSSSGAIAANGGTETFLAGIYQKNTENISCPVNPNQAWTQYSLIRIQNPSGANANDVDVYFYDRDGNTDEVVENLTIEAGKSTNLNTRVNCADIDLGGNWEGSVYITADQPVVAIAQTLWGGTKMNEYNGYSVSR